MINEWNSEWIIVCIYVYVGCVGRMAHAYVFASLQSPEDCSSTVTLGLHSLFYETKSTITLEFDK